MHQRTPLAVSIVALVVAVFGATPLGHAAGRLVAAVPPFAKTASFAKFAGNASKLNGRKSTLKGVPGTIPVVGRDGKLPASIGAVGLQGPQGVQGVKGDKGLKGDIGDKGDAGPSDAYARSVVGPVRLNFDVPTTVASLGIPQAGSYVIWAKTNLVTSSSSTNFVISCDLRAGADADSSATRAVLDGLADTLTAIVVHEFTAAGTADLVCTAVGHSADALRARITAIKVANLTSS